MRLYAAITEMLIEFWQLILKAKQDSYGNASRSRLLSSSCVHDIRFRFINSLLSSDSTDKIAYKDCRICPYINLEDRNRTLVSPEHRMPVLRASARNQSCSRYLYYQLGKFVKMMQRLLTCSNRLATKKLRPWQYPTSSS